MTGLIILIATMIPAGVLGGYAANLFVDSKRKKAERVAITCFGFFAGALVMPITYMATLFVALADFS